ncbi:hypothetical protein [Rhodohalobacter halophilus]|uniref:hypothetical protein n=1 Tax=Rhodohalobacter halophilus TaxID=1812810 RepID=UPI00083F5E73|nr:hypothetical protein [Rhodohalobacter halophilus]
MTKFNNIELDLSCYEVKGLPESWNDRFLEISRQSPVKTDKISIHFDRSPDIFSIPNMLSYKVVPLGLFCRKKLIGIAIASYQKRFIRGVITDVIYLGNMHVIQKGTGHIFLKKLGERVAYKVKNRPEVKYLYGYVMQDNRPGERIAKLGELESKLCGSISMLTLLTLKPMALSSKYTIRNASLADVEQIVSLLANEFMNLFLAPVMNREIFLSNLQNRPGVKIEDYYLALKNGEIVGACLAWDMTTIKKNRIKFRGFKMNFVHKAYNLIARFNGSAKLPEPGEPFRDVTIAEYALADRDPEIMEALLRSVYIDYRQRGFHSIIFGCSSENPIRQATKPFLSREVRSGVVIAPMQEDSVRNFGNVPGIYADAIQI